MAYWLLKSEAETWSFDDQVKAGRKGEPWTGVRNHTAKQNLMQMKKADRAFFYHSGDQRRIVGIVEVIREHYPDPTDESGKFVAVDVRAVRPLATPVTLDTIKGVASLKDMVLVRQSRLSVQPVSAAQWDMICTLGGA